jgi:hypothetical protein
MSYWTGTSWEQDTPAAATDARPSWRRHVLEAIAEGTLVALLVVGLIAGTTFAGKGGNGHGHFASTAGMTFTASPDVVKSGDTFDVNGCGFDTSLGNVIVGFTGGSWGSPLDGAGCFTISGIPALSGDTLPPGTYDVTASQNVNGRWRVVDSTTVTVVKG